MKKWSFNCFVNNGQRMRRRIEQPRILLIACPIEYYKYKYQYASLATLLSQEMEQEQFNNNNNNNNNNIGMFKSL